MISSEWLCDDNIFLSCRSGALQLFAELAYEGYESAQVLSVWLILLPLMTIYPHCHRWMLLLFSQKCSVLRGSMSPKKALNYCQRRLRSAVLSFFCCLIPMKKLVRPARGTALSTCPLSGPTERWARRCRGVGTRQCTPATTELTRASSAEML